MSGACLQASASASSGARQVTGTTIEAVDPADEAKAEGNRAFGKGDYEQVATQDLP